MLKILLPNSTRDTDHLAQMHNLRYKRFVVEYGWTEGLQAVNQMEFDQYDYSDPLYLVDVNKDDRVSAMVRLIHATKTNYTLDKFTENALLTEPAETNDIIELSCTCSDTTNRKALPILIMGLIELGVACDVKHYISTVNELVQSMSDKLKWTSKEISARIALDDQSFVVLKYPVNAELEENFRTLHGFTGPLLSHEEIERSQLKQRILKM